MLDIQLLIEEKGGNPELVKESQRRRGGDVEIIDEIIALYKEWTTSKYLSCYSPSLVLVASFHHHSKEHFN